MEVLSDVIYEDSDLDVSPSIDGVSLKTDQESLTVLTGSLEEATVDADVVNASDAALVETASDDTLTNGVIVAASDADVGDSPRSQRKSYANLGDCAAPEVLQERHLGIVAPKQTFLESISASGAAWPASAATAVEAAALNSSQHNSTSSLEKLTPRTPSGNKVVPFDGGAAGVRSPQGDQPHSPIVPHIFVSQEQIEDKDSTKKKERTGSRDQVGFFIGDLPGTPASITYVFASRRQLDIVTRST